MGTSPKCAPPLLCADTARGEHDSRECTRKDQKKCAGCHEKHISGDRECKKKQRIASCYNGLKVDDIIEAELLTPTQLGMPTPVLGLRTRHAETQKKTKKKNGVVKEYGKCVNEVNVQPEISPLAPTKQKTKDKKAKKRINLLYATCLNRNPP
jgi:hypothetical protein